MNLIINSNVEKILYFDAYQITIPDEFRNFLFNNKKFCIMKLISKKNILEKHIPNNIIPFLKKSKNELITEIKNVIVKYSDNKINPLGKNINNLSDSDKNNYHYLYNLCDILIWNFLIYEDGKNDEKKALAINTMQNILNINDDPKCRKFLTVRIVFYISFYLSYFNSLRYVGKKTYFSFLKFTKCLLDKIESVNLQSDDSYILTLSELKKYTIEINKIISIYEKLVL